MRKETSTNFENEQSLINYCNAHKTLLLIGGRWKLSILFALLEASKGYTELKTVLPSISDRMLSLQLNSLIKDELVIKETTNDKPLYSLSGKGLRLKKVLDELSTWSENEYKSNRL